MVRAIYINYGLQVIIGTLFTTVALASPMPRWAVGLVLLGLVVIMLPIHLLVVAAISSLPPTPIPTERAALHVRLMWKYVAMYVVWLMCGYLLYPFFS